MFGKFEDACLCFYRAIARNATHASHGIAKAFLSVCLSNAWIVTKRKELVPTLLYHVIDHLYYVF